MRPRTNMRNLVSHTTPTYSRLSEEEILRKKFNSGNITKEEKYRLASFIVVRKKSKTQLTEVKIFGQWKSIKSLGLDVNTLISENFELR